MFGNFQSIAPTVHLSDRVADELTTEIRTGKFTVGSKLPSEAALSSQFSVSRTVIREALSRLKSIGLVESRQGSGVFIKAAEFKPLNFDTRLAVSKKAVIQMVEVRRALEAEVAALAAQRRTAADIRSIRQAIVALDDAVSAGNDGVEQDVNFHRAIADAAKNQFLISTLDYLRQFLHGATRVTRANEARRFEFAKQVRDEHEAIAHAIETGDVSLARNAATQHMSNAIARLELAEPIFWIQEGMQLASPLVTGSKIAMEKG
jgi:GntR family transcriptional regulator, transcriptional repressor for pyruvate dehydrogenase complex